MILLAYLPDNQSEHVGYRVLKLRPEPRRHQESQGDKHLHVALRLLGRFLRVSDLRVEGHCHKTEVREAGAWRTVVRDEDARLLNVESSNRSPIEETLAPWRFPCTRPAR